MKANDAVEHNFMGPCSQENTEKRFLEETVNYQSTPDSTHIVGSNRFLQEQGTDGLLCWDSWRALCMLMILVYAHEWYGLICK